MRIETLTPAERIRRFDIHNEPNSPAARGERTRVWAAKQSPEWRSWRARKAAFEMHAQGKTNTKAATAAHVASFATREELSDHMRSLAKRSAEVRATRKAERRYWLLAFGAGPPPPKKQADVSDGPPPVA